MDVTKLPRETHPGVMAIISQATLIYWAVHWKGFILLLAQKEHWAHCSIKRMKTQIRLDTFIVIMNL